ncbi:MULTISPECIES: type III-A CRISPR-associated RAMP protein Csm5 [unclassified Candidatus Frackibacter]|uniref:type III-A CRISPR-associated RAMP protein Csm5 n=1 Tax=unclassified Candidatus Frackibacter TaxID=2648818 RepID=UPI00088A7FDE|nr:MULTISPECIES: type III-A CRISPR-associated RAMP protein Csm5 [unclassified Candidatus Frackibacter]SDC25876.1 RAMP superfamily protein [Candidatus Frackibacter sp. WG11]SEM52863.1 RAMP superfamily protein [Candidatus Frackibacter sp. WG12]SFL55558.1 RAMP superfamily protein [Candidatus Frackibacter sp. WG13]
MELTLQTITPVHIGSGESLSPYSDYIYQSGEVYYIDHQKLEEYLFNLEDATDLINQFVTIIKKQASGNSSDRYKLEDFFVNNSMRLRDFVSKKVTVSGGQIKGEEIQRTISTGNRPYIPGSTLKGAIRTALLYTHLKDDGYNFKRMNRNRSYIGEDLFDKSGNDIMNFLHLSDSEPLLNEEVEVVKTYRLDIKEGKDNIPITKEVIQSGLETNIHLQSKAQKGYHQLTNKFKYLYQNNENEILVRINKFYIDLLEKEIKELKASNGSFGMVISLYTELINEAQELMETKEGAILRLGAGKTFFENSIANLFSENELNRVRKDANLGNHDPFPKTRTVVSNDGKVKEVLGWVRLIKNEVKNKYDTNQGRQNDNNQSKGKVKQGANELKYANLREFVEDRHGAKAFKRMAVARSRGKIKSYNQYKEEFETYKRLHD